MSFAQENLRKLITKKPLLVIWVTLCDVSHKVVLGWNKQKSSFTIEVK